MTALIPCATRPPFGHSRKKPAPVKTGGGNPFPDSVIPAHAGIHISRARGNPYLRKNVSTPKQFYTPKRMYPLRVHPTLSSYTIPCMKLYQKILAFSLHIMIDYHTFGAKNVYYGGSGWLILS